MASLHATAMSRHGTAQHSTAQHSTAQRSVMSQYSRAKRTAHESRVEHSTPEHSTAQHTRAQHSPDIRAQRSTAHSTAQHTAQQSAASMSATKEWKEQLSTAYRSYAQYTTPQPDQAQHNTVLYTTSHKAVQCDRQLKGQDGRGGGGLVGEGAT